MSIVQPWFAIQTKPRNEKKVGYLLRQKGYECITPTYRQRRKWSDRTVEVDFPLFPMYVFCCLNSSSLGKAISTSGVIKIVGFDGKPAEIPVEEIEAIRRLMQSDLLREPWRYLCDGTQVIVETGPLAGVQGIISKEGPGRKNLIISVSLLQRSVAVQLEEDAVISIVADLNRNRNRGNAESDIAATLLSRM
jgi:transcription antitermination factor NusG